MKKLFKIQLNKYLNLKIKPQRGGVEYIQNTKQFELYQEAYDGSPTNKSVINRFGEYIYGQGLFLKDSDLNILDTEIVSRKDLTSFIIDFKKYGSACFLVKYNLAGEVAKLEYVDVSKVAINKEESPDDPITKYFYCYDFSQIGMYDVTEIPALGYGERSEFDGKPIESELAYLRNNDRTDFYSLPDWSAGIQYCLIEQELSNFQYNHLKKKFSVQSIISLSVGDSYTEEELLKRVEEFETQFTGSEGDTHMINFIKNKDYEPIITSLSIPFDVAEYTYLTDNAKMNILQSHSINNPILFNVPAPSGFSSQAEDRIVSELQLIGSTIENYRIDICEYIYDILGKEVYFKDKEQIIVDSDEEGSLDKAFMKLLDKNNNSKSVSLKEEVKKKDSEMFSFVKDKAKPYNHDGDEYSDIHTAEVNHVSQVIGEINLGEIKLNSVLDNSSFIVRYRYSPQALSYDKDGNMVSRDFCQMMVGLGNVEWTLDDLVAMEDQPVNPGFGPRGASTYNIFAYKGGVNCKHRFLRVIRLKNGSEISKRDAERILGAINSIDDNNFANFSEYESVYGNGNDWNQIAGPQNNYWRLN